MRVTAACLSDIGSEWKKMRHVCREAWSRVLVAPDAAALSLRVSCHNITSHPSSIFFDPVCIRLTCVCVSSFETSLDVGTRKKE